MHLRQWAERVWYGDSWLAVLLQPLAWLFAAGAALRRLAYRRGWFAAPALPVPVVVVGNITVGGSGKTPVVIWLAEALRRRGYRPAIVSRGYGGRVSSVPRMVKGGDAAADVGDEPLVLREATGLPVCVCAHRVSAVRKVAALGATVAIADDGLQHYALRRAFEFVVVDGRRRFGNGRRLPAGPLRESLDRLNEADAVLLNGGDERAGEPGRRFDLVQGAARRLGKPDVSRPLAAFAGQRVWAVAGIGDPERFFEQLRCTGIQVDAVPLDDHGRIDLLPLLREREQPVLMTEKDAVKYPGLPGDFWVVPVTVQFPPHVAALLLDAVENALRSAQNSAAVTE